MTTEEILIKLGVDGSTVARGLRSVGDKVNEWSHEMSHKVKEAFSELAAPIAGLFAVEKIRESIRESMEYGKQLKINAETWGVTTDFVQGAESAMNKLGINAESASAAMAILNRKVGEARSGADEAQKIFAKWGINIEGKTQEEIFYAIADKAKSLGDQSERAALAFETMGRGSKEMAQALGIGSEAWKSMIDSADKLSEAQIEKLHTLDAKMEEIGRKWKMFWGGLVTNITDVDLPAPGGVTEEEIEKRAREIAEKRGKKFDKEYYDAENGPHEFRPIVRTGLREAAIEEINKEAAARTAATQKSQAETKKEASEDKEVARIQAESDKKAQANRHKELSTEERMNALITERTNLELKYGDVSNSRLQTAKLVLALNENETEIIKTQKELEKEKTEAEKEAAKEAKEIAREKTKSEMLAEQTRITSLHKDEALNAPFTSTLDELSKSGFWRRGFGGRQNWVDGPHAWQARRMEWLQKDGQMANQLGNTERFKADKAEYWKINTQLENSGVINPTMKLQEIEEHLSLLARKANGENGGLAVDPAMAK